MIGNSKVVCRSYDGISGSSQTIDKLDYRATEKWLKFPILVTGGKMVESWGRIEFSTTASLSFTSLGANFPRNLAAENSITPPFHLAELILRQIFTDLNLIGG